MGKASRTIFEEFNDFEKMFGGFRRAIAYVTRDDRWVLSGRKTQASKSPSAGSSPNY
jgi:hypothetical protein